MINKTRTIDLPLLFAVFALWIVSLLLVYSTSVHGSLQYIFKSQVVWVIMGFFVIMAMVTIRTETIYTFAPAYYLFTLILLAVVLVAGESAKGAARWIPLGGVRIQPSEFAKLGLLIMLARHLSKNEISLYRLKSLLIPSVIIIIPFLMVLKQPNLGTALVFIAMSLTMFYWAGMTLVEIFFILSPALSIVASVTPMIVAYGAGVPLTSSGSIPWAIFFFALVLILLITRPPRYVVVGVIAINLLVAMSTNFIWNSEQGLKDYQKKRVVSFIHPQADPRGAGYQVIQSIITMGSGQVAGKGYLKGSQVNLAYLPEQHTDFIFSVLGEQFGFVGCVVVLGLLLFVIVRTLLSTRVLRCRYANLLLAGGAAMLGFHVVVNIAMVIGMMPVTGLPLPLLSYGGSFLLSISLLLGIILSVRLDQSNY